MRISPLTALTYVTFVASLAGCASNGPEQQTTQETSQPAVESGETLSKTDPRLVEPKCSKAVAEKLGEDPFDFIAANTRQTPTGARVDVSKIGGIKPWICELNKEGEVVSLTAP